LCRLRRRLRSACECRSGQEGGRSLSALSEIAVGGGQSLRGPDWTSRSRLERVERAERPLARLLSFSALAFYGVLRWATLVSPAPGARLFALLALAVCVAGLGPTIDRRSRPLAIVAAIISILVMLMICGVPAGWLIRFRVAVISQGIGDGLSALPGLLVPYIGINAWVKLVILLGAGVLLLDAALMIAFAPRSLGDVRRAAAALPLIALAVIPSTIARPHLAYLQGLILFALIAAFVWSERAAAHHIASAILVAGAAGVFGLVLAPSLDRHHPWVNYQSLTSGLANRNLDTFDWRQTYGPLSWPQQGRIVLEVKAPTPDYWKAENLDVFNGTAWAQGAGLVGSQLPPPAQWAVERFTQTLQVTIGQMRTGAVIAAGSATEPQHVGQGVVPGISDGTWTANSPLGPGDSYTVSAYSPHPDAAALQAINASDSFDQYPLQLFEDELTVELPSDRLTLGRPPQVAFALFHSGQIPQNVLGPYNVTGAQLIERSPYAPAYALAQRLAGRAATPYAFAISVEHYLSPQNGFTYDQTPPLATYPLETFLFKNKHGYCQQFAGAMALLLRMGGVPARVVTGFLPGDYDTTTKQYVVDDTDAHAWVEAWFPTYGWVRFDPTPAARAAGGGPPLLPGQAVSKHTAKDVRRLSSSALGPASTRRSRGRGSPLVWIVLGALGALVALGMLAVLALRRWTPPTDEQLLAELERALARSGRPLAGGTTLAALEHRFHTSPEAENYVRALRLARFAGIERIPGAAERRALRGELAAGLGTVGRLRAWWALPPRFLN
jgi:transglutaminase-like putative cysteine protease